MTLEVEAAGAAHAPGLVALFDAAGSPCFCRYWHFAGDKNEWLARCAERPSENRDAFSAALGDATGEARGVVALRGGALVGWLKVAPRGVMDKLYDQRLYRRLPCFADAPAGTFTVGCALVHPAHRRQGVARALVAGAVRIAPSWGARALEAFPRRPREAVTDEELWTGPASVYFDAGFVEVHAFEPYPVLRRML